MLFSSNEILEALKNEIVNHHFNGDFTIDEVVIDSRKCAPNKLFFALKGENNDGHEFLEQVFASNCELAIIHKEELLTKFPDKNLILVKDSFTALYKLAEYVRHKSPAKFIAVTGSVGKTGVKEMLKLAFSAAGRTYATSGNLNNHFGVPLTLCNMPKNTEFAVIEMGMNHLNEIDPLSKLTKPHIAIITTIAPAHIGNFNSEEEIALAKSEIFSGLLTSGFALINSDNKYFNFLKSRASKAGVREENILSFGNKLDSIYELEHSDIKTAHSTIVKAKTKNHGEVSYEISTSHQATIFNSIIILAALDLLCDDINAPLQMLKKVSHGKGRGQILEVKIGDKNITIIDDSYNANLASIKAGIDYLDGLKHILNKKRSVAILGDMFELGKYSDKIHKEAVDYAQKQEIDLILVAGAQMQKAINCPHCSLFSQIKKFFGLNVENKNYHGYPDAPALASSIKDLLQDGDILLVKGSRGMKMEKVIESII